LGEMFQGNLWAEDSFPEKEPFCGSQCSQELAMVCWPGKVVLDGIHSMLRLWDSPLLCMCLCFLHFCWQVVFCLCCHEHCGGFQICPLQIMMLWPLSCLVLGTCKSISEACARRAIAELWDRYTCSFVITKIVCQSSLPCSLGWYFPMCHIFGDTLLLSFLF
jgi:hypothetical protein